MTKKTAVNVDFLRPGMTVADDVYRHETLLVSAGVTLTTNAILLLKKNDIRQITIAIKKPDSLREVEQTYHLSLALIKKFLQDFREFRSINLETLDAITHQILQNQRRLQLFEFTHLLRSKDDYTYNHCLSVALLTLMLGEWVGFQPRENLILAGLLHDIGKLEIDASIISKPGPLTPLEWEIIKKHPEYSAQLIQNHPYLPNEVFLSALYHHERVDGSGYPFGLTLEEIPPVARLVAICDVFDAMTSRRPYKNSENVFRVLHYLYSCKTVFDWRYLDSFVLNMLELLTGENVLLSTGQRGKLIFINRYAPFKPLIKMDSQFVDLVDYTDIQIESVVFSPS